MWSGIRARCGLGDAGGVVPFLFSRDALHTTTLVFRVEDCDPPWRSWFSPCPMGPKEALLAPLRCGEALRAIPVPNRHGLKAAQQPPAVRSSSAHSSRARTAERAGAGAAQHWPPNHCVCRRVPRYPSHHARSARLQRDAITLCRRAPQSSPSRPTVRARLKVLS